jgi:WD40 repeat protein
MAQRTASYPSTFTPSIISSLVLVPTKRNLWNKKERVTKGALRSGKSSMTGKPIHPDKKNIRILYGLFDADKNTNVVRYSPHGGLLASGSDDKCITIWEKR